MGRDDENKRKRRQTAANYPSLTKYLKDSRKTSIAKTLDKFRKDEISEGDAENPNANVPEGYSTLYVLTSGEGLVIEQVNGTPDFTVTAAGDYTIHTLVYPAGLDLSVVVPGVTTGSPLS